MGSTKTTFPTVYSSSILFVGTELGWDTVFGTWLGRIRITWGNPQSACSDICSYSKRATVGVRAPMWPSETLIWSESSVDERNLYFARSTIIGLAVETWRVKTELIIITILHIIIITTSILNLGLKTFAPKILAHTICINRYWNIHKYLAVKNQANLLQNRTGRTDCKNHKTLKCWRPPTIHKIIIYIKMLAPHVKCRRPT